jgi:intein-encoded DNA endonuclease-like protein
MRPNVHLEIPELGYVIGVMLGDGYLEKRRTRTYVLRLLAKDRDFCETFSRALASTVNREAQYPIYRHDEVLYVVYGSSKSLNT